MFDSLLSENRYLAILIFLVIQGLGSVPADAQTFTATRVDGRPATSVFDPIIDLSTFSDVGSSANNNAGGNASTGPGNINGPSVIRVPDWIPSAERVDANANYYMYFAHHAGHDIRMAWSDSLTGDWTVFNAEGSSAPDRAWGVNGGNTGTQTPGHGVLEINGGQLAASSGSDFVASNHIASPEVLVDHENERIAMYFHATTQFTGGPGQGTGQVSWVTTSKYGLNFNPEHAGGEPGQGMREVVTTRAYARTFQVGGQTFAYTNEGELWKAPFTNDAGEINTLANADSEGGLWNPSGANTTASWWGEMSAGNNPLSQLYINNGQDAKDVRHPHAYTRTHIDANDTNVYLFYSSRNDLPESIFLSVIDTNNGSTNTGDWEAIGQRTILKPELDWEGGDIPIADRVPSQNGASHDAYELRDPYIFEDDQGTSDPSDDLLYIFYTGEGEEAIGFAQLNFEANTSNATAQQGDLFGNIFNGLPCDYVNRGDGCDIQDLNALYAGTNGAPAFTTTAIQQWLDEASGDNPAKQDPAHQYVLGDVDLNGSVDSVDLGLLLNNFGDTSSLGWDAGNLTTDSSIDSADLGVLLNQFPFASASATATVPEPSHLTFFGICFFCIAWRWGRNAEKFTRESNS